MGRMGRKGRKGVGGIRVKMFGKLEVGVMLMYLVMLGNVFGGWSRGCWSRMRVLWRRIMWGVCLGMWSGECREIGMCE